MAKLSGIEKSFLQYLIRYEQMPRRRNALVILKSLIQKGVVKHDITTGLYSWPTEMPKEN